MKKTSPEELLAAGVHFGHKKWRIHPKSHQYIHKIERGASIIDLFKTVEELEKAKQFVFNLGKENKSLLVIGTKKQAKPIVFDLCSKNDIPYIAGKWIGGLITNFDEILKNIKKMQELNKEKGEGSWNKLPKHEMVKMEKELVKLERVYRGVLTLDKIPAALFVIDIKKEHTAVTEARRRGITTVAIADTNADPRLVDYPIPGNDDAISSISFLTEVIIDAYVEGRQEASEKKPEPAA